MLMKFCNMNSKSFFFVILVISLLNISSVPICVGQHFFSAKFHGKIKGEIGFKFSHHKNVEITVNIKHGLQPGIVHPFHVHVFNVKIPGNCTSTGGHLDPTNVSKVPKGQIYKCDPNQLNKCEVGDLSGKYGGLSPDNNGFVHKVIHDNFLQPNNGPYGVEGRSVVIHLPDVAKTRIDCADILPSHHNKRRRLNRLLY